MDCEKLVQEKTEMQRHYVMVSNHRQTQFPTLEIELSINEKVSLLKSIFVNVKITK